MAVADNRHRNTATGSRTRRPQLKITITPAQPIDPAGLRSGLSAAGLHNVSVRTAPRKRLEITCRDDELRQMVAAIAHDGRIKGALICANNLSGGLKNLTVHDC